MSLFADVKRLWMRNCPSGWWGDHIDIRFYVYKRLSQLRKKRVLDIACGGGILLTALDASNEAHGLELDHGKAAAARKLNPKAKVVEGSMLKLPYKNGYFDVVVLANVLPGFDFAGTEKERQKAVAEAKRVLRKGGMLLLTTPNAEWYHTNKADESDIEPLLEGTAYKVRGWNPFPRWLPTRLLALVPGMMNWLERDMLANEPGARKAFFVEAVKL